MNKKDVNKQSTKVVTLFENLINIDELIKRLPFKRSKATIYRWCEDGLPFYQTKYGRLFDFNLVCRWITERSNNGSV